MLLSYLLRHLVRRGTLRIIDAGDRLHSFSGEPGPTISALTRIGTVEGFGGMLRLLRVPDFRRCFEEDITGTAIAHIDHGLFEAHARDEAGFGDLAGHDRRRVDQLFALRGARNILLSLSTCRPSGR